MGSRRRTFVITGLLAVPFLLAGCFAGTPPTIGEPAPGDDPARGSTPEPWAEVALAQKAEWDAWADNWDAAACPELAAVVSASIDCKVLGINAESLATTASAWWAATLTPGHSEFISSDPPAEVADLVAATQAAADVSSAAGTAWLAADCGNQGAEGCPDLGSDFDEAIQRLRSEMSRWEQYAL